MIARLSSRRLTWILVGCVLALAGSVAALLGARAVRTSDADKEHLAFHLAAADITSTLKLAIQHEEDLVVNASAFVSGTPGMSATRFDRWVKSVRALQRYPELQNIGLVERVPATQLAGFRERLTRHPVEPFGPHRPRPREAFSILPPGPRPVYCFAVAGLSRNLATYLPVGLDYCALEKALESARITGESSYAPFMGGHGTTLGVQTPVYRGGVIPASAAARKRGFIGWLGELFKPDVLLRTALAGHSSTAVTFRYGSDRSHIVFHAGTVASRAQSTTIDLHNGWTVRSSAAAPGTGILDDPHAVTLLLGGVALSSLLGLLVFMLGTGRMRALSLVREKTRELSHLALHDALTGLPNRALVLDRAERMLAHIVREPGMAAGALFVDVDGFKHVNDNLGHAAGDTLLRVVGERLQGAVRAQDTVGRLGGDEFVVLVESSACEETADVLADRLVEALRLPVDLDERHPAVAVTASIGVAIGRYETSDALLRDADLALYAAKAAGKDRYSLFDAGMHADVEGRVALEVDLASALTKEQFFLLYQPIYDLTSGRIDSVEALLRWRHPVRGIVAPEDFIPLAEESGQIVAIGRWVLEEASRQAATWSRAGREVGISVNVSAYQLGRDEFAEDVQSALASSGIDPSSLMLEITETALMRDVSTASRHLKEIKTLGVSVAIDDFGTGYASLSQLQRMPVDVLKVDRSFIAGIEDGPQSRDLLEAIVGVGRSLSLKVIAEGIETDRQLQVVSELGCEMAQGYLTGRPAPAEVLEGLLGLRPVGAPIATHAN